MTQRLAVTAAQTLVGLMAIEVLARVISGSGLVTVPETGIGGFDRSVSGEVAPPEKRLYRPDRDLIYALRESADITYHRNPVFPGRPSVYRVQVNALGMRERSFLPEKTQGVFRIACVGDSSTFGYNVDVVDTYPRRLQVWLDAAYPGRFEVLNFGVVGYTSRQVLELLRQRVLRFHPDLVLFAAGTNDQYWRAPLTDDEQIALNQSPVGGLLIATRAGFAYSRTYGVLRAVIRHLRPPRVNPELKLRVPRGRIPSIIAEARQAVTDAGSHLVVVHLDLLGVGVRAALARGARNAGVSFVDVAAEFSRRRRLHAAELARERRLATRTPPLLFRALAEGTTGVVVQVALPGPPVLVERVHMRDDGRLGDEQANDGVWTAQLAVEAGVRFSYMYWRVRNNELEREFDEPYHPIQRWHAADADSGPLDELGVLFLMADSAHPNEEGHQIIADLLGTTILQSEFAQRFLAGLERGSGDPQ